MGKSGMLKRSPSLPCSPLKSSENIRFQPSRKSPRRRTSLEARPVRSPLSHQSRGIPRRRTTSHSLEEIMTASSSGSTGSSSGGSIISSPNSALSLPTGDSEEIPRGSMRKRSHVRSPTHSGIKIRKTTTSSLSFRRKKLRKNFLNMLRSRKTITRFFVILSMLFVLSFSMAFLSTQSPESDETSLQETKNVTRRMNVPTKQRQTTRLRKHTESTSSESMHSNSGGGKRQEKARLRGTQSSDVSSNNVSLVKFQRSCDGAPSCSPIPESQVDFTVVTQLSTNRLWMMKHHCFRWKRSFSIAVYVPPDDHDTSRTTIEDDLEKMGCGRDRINVSIVTGFSEEEYPVNVLRNRALSTVRTSHVVYVDIDFWESEDLYSTLQNHIKTLAEDPKQTLVVPAFQLNRQCKDWRECREKNIPLMPLDKNSLLDLMVQDEPQANAFDPTNVGGHGSTRYRDWLEQPADKLLSIDCVKSNRYEPYLIFRYCRDLPPFQEAFTGYGKNKMTWVMHLRRSGYKIGQLGQSFVVHYPHLDSKARMHWNGGKKGQQLRRKPLNSNILDYKRGQIDQTFIDFRRWLEATVPDETLVPKCKESLDDDKRLWISK